MNYSDIIAKEYSKKRPNKRRIGELAIMSGRLDNVYKFHVSVLEDKNPRQVAYTKTFFTKTDADNYYRMMKKKGKNVEHLF